MSINFQFIAHENLELYNKCCYAEQFAKTFPNNSVVETRKALEFFLQRTCHLENVKFNADELSYIPKNGIKAPNPTIHNMIEKTVRINIFSKKQKEAMMGIKKIGNESAHVNYKGEDEEVELTDSITTKQAIFQIQALHQLLREYYDKKYPKTPPFDAMFIPIDSMIPMKILAVESNEACKVKVLCKIMNEETGNEMYYIVRQYVRVEIDKDKTFILRDMFTLEKLSQGGTSAQNLVKYVRINVQKQNDLFFTCYEISRDAVSLDQFSCGNLQTKERLELISGIANGVEELHMHSIPIVHRYLRPSSIFIFNSKKAHICNFEYAKLENPQQATVSKEVMRRNDPFKAPELSTEKKITLWPSVDIYSLGVIILYVFGISIKGELTPVKLIACGMSKAFVNTIHDMLSDVSQDRPNIQKVKQVIQTEVARHA